MTSHKTTSKVKTYITNVGSTVTDNPKQPYLIIRPKDHDGWLKERNMGIGASECSKVIGASKYGTPVSLFCDKLGINPPVVENWAMEQGHIFERVVAEKFQQQKNFKVIGLSQSGTVKADWLACSRAYNFLRVSPDYLYWLKDNQGNDLPHNLKNRGLLECKTSVKHYTPECLKNECLSWYCQVQYQMYVLNLRDAYLGFLCVDSLSGGESWFQRIEYNEDFCVNTLIPAIVDLWTNHIYPALQIKDIKPQDEVMKFAPDPISAEDVTKRYSKEETGKYVKAEDIEDFYDQLSIYLQRKQTIKSLEEEQKTFESKVKMAMLDSESIIDSDNNTLVTFKASKSSMKLDSDKLKAEHPELYAQYLKEQDGTRRLIFK